MYIVYAKIGLGDVEIIGLTEVVKGLKKTSRKNVNYIRSATAK